MLQAQERSPERADEPVRHAVRPGGRVDEFGSDGDVFVVRARTPQAEQGGGRGFDDELLVPEPASDGKGFRG